MKKQINVRIYKDGSENSCILNAITSMNEGLKNFTARDLEGYLNTRNAIYPGAIQTTLIKSDEPGEVYNVTGDGGKTFTLTLEWCEVHELTPETIEP